MLNQTSIPGPSFKDPDIKVRILNAIYVKGVIAPIGTELKISKSDAHALRNHCPPTIEIL